jgi:hypothetical protein
VNYVDTSAKLGQMAAGTGSTSARLRRIGTVTDHLLESRVGAGTDDRTSHDKNNIHTGTAYDLEQRGCFTDQCNRGDRRL